MTQEELDNLPAQYLRRYAYLVYRLGKTREEITFEDLGLVTLPQEFSQYTSNHPKE